MSRPISAADILPLDQYEAVRPARRKALVELKRDRRVAVGPHVTAYFECFDTMLHQIHEMLRIEKGGAAQLEGELEAYNALVPGGDELVATVMVEIDDERLRHRVLSGLGGIEHAFSIEVGGERVAGEAEDDLDRTTADGKASSVQFVHFRFTPGQIAAFRRPGAGAVLRIDHPNYGHMAAIPEPVRAALAADFD